MWGLGPCGRRLPSRPGRHSSPEATSRRRRDGRMILGRRDRPSILQRLRGWLWPRAGWRRAGRYLLARIKRLPGTPHAIAAGLATGVAVSLTPFLGLHVLLALGLARLTGGNLLAAGMGTLVSNPWTLSLIWTAATYRLGCLILERPPRGLHLLADLHRKLCSA